MKGYKGDMIEPIAVYIHWPYCLKKCPYCDFNSHVATSVDHAQWRNLYRAEINHYQSLLGKRRVTSVFFGGGTPSLMEVETVHDILQILSEGWDIDPSCEITLEANPTSIEADKFKSFQQAGVNRASVGIQSLRDDVLQFLGREHNANEALKALDIAKACFDRVSFDLIYALPDQTMDDWRDDLTQAIQLAKGHLSLYQLTIEPNTRFQALYDRGLLRELDPDQAADMYEMTADMMGQAHMPAYEISNYATQRQESRHNLTYWRYEDYVGIGPGAHGRLTLENGQKVATQAKRIPDHWMKAVQQYGHGGEPMTTLPQIEQWQERLLMGLRLREGVNIADVPLDQSKLQHLIDHRFVVRNGDVLQVLPSQWIILDSILSEITLSAENEMVKSLA